MRAALFRQLGNEQNVLLNQPRWNREYDTPRRFTISPRASETAFHMGVPVLERGEHMREPTRSDGTVAATASISPSSRPQFAAHRHALSR